MSQPPLTLAYYALRTTYYALRTTYYVLRTTYYVLRTDEPCGRVSVATRTVAALAAVHAPAVVHTVLRPRRPRHQTTAASLLASVNADGKNAGNSEGGSSSGV
jgi:hypothetical protein